MVVKFNIELYGGDFAVATTIEEYKELMRNFAKFSDKDIEDTIDRIEEDRIITSVPGDKGKKDRHVALIHTKNMTGYTDLIVPSLIFAFTEYARVFTEPPISVDMIGRLQKKIFEKLNEELIEKVGELEPPSSAAEEPDGGVGTPSGTVA